MKEEDDDANMKTKGFFVLDSYPPNSVPQSPSFRSLLIPNRSHPKKVKKSEGKKKEAGTETEVAAAAAMANARKSNRKPDTY